MIRCCHATEEHIPGILPLMGQLGYPTNLDDLKLRFQRFMEQKGTSIVVALDHDTVVAWIAWSRSWFFVDDLWGYRIEGLVVDETYRGQGIGKKLMHFMETEIMNDGPCEIELTSYLSRAKDGTHAFYRFLGYHNDGPMEMLYLRKKLEWKSP